MNKDFSFIVENTTSCDLLINNFCGVMCKIGGCERHCDKNERRTVRSEINITDGTELLEHRK